MALSLVRDRDRDDETEPTAAAPQVASALTAEESASGSITRLPATPECLESATLERNGSLIVWSGAGEPVVIPDADHNAVAALLMQGKISPQHLIALADAIQMNIMPHTTATIRELYAQLLMYYPPVGRDTASARWEALSGASRRVDDPPNLDRLNTRPASVLWTVNRAMMFTSACGDAASEFWPPESAPRSMFEVFHSDDPNNPIVAAHLTALSGKAAEFEHSDRKLRRWYGHLEPIRRGGKLIGIVGYAVDNDAGTKAPIPEMEVAFASISAEGALITYSRPFKQIFGVTPNHALAGRPILCDTFLDQIADRMTFIEVMTKALVGQTPVSDFVEMADGRCVHLYLHPVLDAKQRVKSWALYLNCVLPDPVCKPDAKPR